MESTFDQITHAYPLENIFTVILLLRVWVMYGRNQRLGLFLGALCVTALVTALVVPYKQPNVGQVTYYAAYTHIDIHLDLHWCDTIMYVLSSLLTSFFTKE